MIVTWFVLTVRFILNKNDVGDDDDDDNCCDVNDDDDFVYNNTHHSNDDDDHNDDDDDDHHHYPYHHFSIVQMIDDKDNGDFNDNTYNKKNNADCFGYKYLKCAICMHFPVVDSVLFGTLWSKLTMACLPVKKISLEYFCLQTLILYVRNVYVT